jgi:hypothetical protein
MAGKNKKKKPTKARTKEQKAKGQPVAESAAARTPAVTEPAADAATISTPPVAQPPSAPKAAAETVGIPVEGKLPKSLRADMAKVAASALEKVEHFTVDERVSLGKAVRVQAPLESHADWSRSPYRVDPVTLLEE